MTQGAAKVGDVLGLLDLLDHIGWSQVKLARAIGTSEPSVSHWVNGKVNPEPETAERIGALTGTEPTFREGKVVFRVLPGGPKVAKEAPAGEAEGPDTETNTVAPSAEPAPDAPAVEGK